MFKHFLIALPVLILATSCVPNDEAPQVTKPRVVLTAPVLLQKLDLNVPQNVIRTLSTHVASATPSIAVAAPAAAFLATTQSADDGTRAIDCLTAAVYYEARSQTDDGQRAVAQVVVNRVRDPAFPSSVCGVVYQGSHRATGCQFSFTCDGSLYRPLQPAAWNHAHAVAISALSGSVYAPVGSAVFYHADYVNPWWAGSMSRIVQIGAHIFYRFGSALENALAFRQRYSGVEPVVSGGVGGTNGGSGATTTMAGVTIHYGSGMGTDSTAPAPATMAAATPAPMPAVARIEKVGSVTIHRGAPGGNAVPWGEAIVTPDAPSDPHTRSATGIRVHRGFDPPSMAPSDRPASGDATT